MPIVPKMPQQKNKYYRFTFAPSSIKKEACYSCRTPKKYRRYIDLITRELLPIEYGICDRKYKCGYHEDPYKDGYAYSIRNKEKDLQVVKIPRTTEEIPKIVHIPFNYLEDSLGDYDNNTFVQYLIKLLGQEKTDELIERFFIGTSEYWDGSTVFWLVDEDINVRGGQVILYDDQGKTYKKDLRNGKVSRYNSWVHIAIKKYHEEMHPYVPQWISDYNKGAKYPIPFGLHQLRTESKDKPVAIVESAKTATIATAYFPQYIWLAIGSLNFLNEKRLSPIIGRKITLFPDNGAFFIWSEKAQALSHLDIVVSELLEVRGEQGSDLADYLVKFDWREFP